MERTISDQLREAIKNSGLTRYRMGRIAGVDPAILCGFLKCRRGMSLKSLESLAGCLGLDLVKTRPGVDFGGAWGVSKEGEKKRKKEGGEKMKRKKRERIGKHATDRESVGKGAKCKTEKERLAGTVSVT